MTEEKLNNLNVLEFEVLVSPDEIKNELPITPEAEKTVLEGRTAVKNILDRKDPRFIVVVGPCSIHDPKAAIEYATKLKHLADDVSDTLLLIMRVYFEKPRTTVGWKGYINDPYLDDSFKIQDGLYGARRLLLYLAEMGLPAANEALDPITPQYISDLISWSAIGARTTESQTHREMASGLSMPVGFKNATDGSVQVAIDALLSAKRPHHFLGIDPRGQTSIFRTRGNSYGHIVLRGGSERPNYDAESVKVCELSLEKAGIATNIVVDCSHANSFKDHNLQPMVFSNVVDQLVDGNKSIMGVMIESNLFAGNQPIPKDLTRLKYGVSVTDKCIDWVTTEEIIRQAYERLKGCLPDRINLLSKAGC